MFSSHLSTGLLIQCAKCKQAYYCSRDCFNQDLEEHKKHCASGILEKEPFSPELRSPTRSPLAAKPKTLDQIRLRMMQSTDNGKVVPTVSKADKTEPETKLNLVPELEPCRESDDANASDNDSDGSVEDIEVVELEEDPCEKQEYTVQMTESPKEVVSPPSVESPSQATGMNLVADLSEPRSSFGVGSIPKDENAKESKVDLREVSTDEGNKYAWKKPDWALKSPLKKTEKGKVAKTKGNLAAPITHINRLKLSDDSGPNKLSGVDLNNLNDAPFSPSRDELLTLKPSSFESPKTSTFEHQTVPRGDVTQSPRTPMTGPTFPTIGCDVQLGVHSPDSSARVNLQEGQSSPSRDIGWSKPDWALKQNLRKTDKGDLVKTKGCIAKPTTQATAEAKWEKPDWAKGKS